MIDKDPVEIEASGSWIDRGFVPNRMISIFVDNTVKNIKRILQSYEQDKIDKK